MRVGVVGLGKTARVVVSVLLENGFKIEWIVRRKSDKAYFEDETCTQKIPVYSKNMHKIDEILSDHPVDVIVDFSSEDGIDYYANEAANRKIAIVSAISNYSLDKIKLLMDLSKKTCVFYSPNITIGINFLLLAAKVLKKIAPTADISIVEEHFSQKHDVSGTAKVIANNLNIKHGEIKSIRAGGIVGTHEILFGFPYQTVRLKHESISREAFGNGIKFVLEKLPIKTAGFYNMESLITPFFREDRV